MSPQGYLFVAIELFEGAVDSLGRSIEWIESVIVFAVKSLFSVRRGARLRFRFWLYLHSNFIVNFVDVGVDLGRCLATSRRAITPAPDVSIEGQRPGQLSDDSLDAAVLRPRRARASALVSPGPWRRAARGRARRPNYALDARRCLDDFVERDRPCDRGVQRRRWGRSWGAATCWQTRRTERRVPLSSAPMTLIATGPVRAASPSSTGPWASSTIAATPRRRAPPGRRGQGGDAHSLACSIAPADARKVAGVSAPSRARATGWPGAPRATALRITAPKFCGSMTPSSATGSVPAPGWPSSTSTGISSTPTIRSSGAEATAPWWRRAGAAAIRSLLAGRALGRDALAPPRGARARRASGRRRAGRGPIRRALRARGSPSRTRLETVDARRLTGAGGGACARSPGRSSAPWRADRPRRGSAGRPRGDLRRAEIAGRGRGDALRSSPCALPAPGPRRMPGVTMSSPCPSASRSAGTSCGEATNPWTPARARELRQPDHVLGRAAPAIRN